MQGGLLLDIVIRQSSAVLKLLAGKDQALLIRRNAFLVLNLGFDVIDGIARFNFKGNGLARNCRQWLALYKSRAVRCRVSLRVLTKICMMIVDEVKKLLLRYAEWDGEVEVLIEVLKFKAETERDWRGRESEGICSGICSWKERRYEPSERGFLWVAVASVALMTHSPHHPITRLYHSSPPTTLELPGTV